MDWLKAFMAASLLGSTAILATPVATWAQNSDWRGRDVLEYTQPGRDQGHTLRVVRYNGDLQESIDDQGSVAGWAKAAVEGEVDPRVEEDAARTETLEIMKRSEVKKALDD